jgi:hypothetical protein
MMDIYLFARTYVLASPHASEARTQQDQNKRDLLLLLPVVRTREPEVCLLPATPGRRRCCPLLYYRM